MDSSCPPSKSDLRIGGPVKLAHFGFWGTEATREQIRHLAPSSLVLTGCHFTDCDHARQESACIRASGGRLIVNGCKLINEDKQPILLEKGLKATTIIECCFRESKGNEDHPPVTFRSSYTRARVKIRAKIRNSEVSL